MGRIFFADVPTGRECASCGNPITTKIDELTELLFCDYGCYEAWVADHAEDIAKELARTRLYDYEVDE